MISVRSISLEYKSTALFAALALLLSLVIGFAVGIRWDVVLVRSVILMVLFAGIGFGICIVMQKFVPEVYQYLAGMAGAAQAPEAGAADIGLPEPGSAESAGEGAALPEGGGEGGEQAAAAPGEFTELEKEGLAQYSTAPGGAPVNTRSGKLGKHILEKEKMAKYEPKIMAQAVRTMMSKDRE